ncbi:MAG: twin-arginine translocase TatA/TatE family subunit [Verrucomicrobiae bacterium]|nr:twin-arginine translocase TatA/TatE family subunit [Verrucomicrobiae bacterium]
MTTLFPIALGLPAGPEWLAIIFVVLLLFGAKRLPELARGLGRSIGEFKKAKDEFTNEIEKASQIETRNSPNTVSTTQPTNPPKTS